MSQSASTETPNPTTPFSQSLEFLSLHPFIRNVVHDKLRGTMVGAALGDCIGLYTEFLPKKLANSSYPDGKFQLVHPTTPFIADSHRNKFEPRAWTDDTDHALMILLSYLHHDGTEVSSKDLAERLRVWVDQGLRCLDRPPLGLGKTVGRVVCDKYYLENPSRIAYRIWALSRKTIAPNGSLMRTHPLGIICLASTLPETFQVAADFSVITHADPRCILSCCITTALIRGMMRGEVICEKDIDDLMESSYAWVGSWLGNGRNGAAFDEEGDEPADQNELLDRQEFDKHVRSNSFEELELDNSATMGYVYKALGAAILSLRLAMRQAPLHSAPERVRASSSVIFERIITEITFEGGDADTNACIAGGLLGCWLGYNSLPAHWRDGMDHHDWLVDKCEALSQIVGVGYGNPGYKGHNDLDTQIDGGKGLMGPEELKERDRKFMDRYMRRTLESKEMDEQKKKRGWSTMFSTITG